jgi:hypothetical protein
MARRSEFDRLTADANKRRFDVVCVWKFDRFARSVSHLIRAPETFKALGELIPHELRDHSRLVVESSGIPAIHHSIVWVPL